ncbi:hypothetical protein [Streptosporangium roseum]|uniref:hypothetical protein n=1 Tax=Streptosporangium roseum TaxID=2001 RepID=UPI00331BD29C
MMENERDIAVIKLPWWGRVEARPADVVPFPVVDALGQQVEPIGRYLRDSPCSRTS